MRIPSRSWRNVGFIALPLFILAGQARSAGKGKVIVEKVEYRGWKNNLRLSNGDAELVLTLDVGPRVISYKLKDGDNVFKNFKEEMGKSGEPEWQSRGGHRLWVGPEDLTRTYAPDNNPIKHEIVNQSDGSVTVKLKPPADAPYGIQKEMEVTLASKGSKVTVGHRITNVGKEPTSLAVWVLTVMAPGGIEVIPLPPKRPHPGPPKNAKSAADFAPNQFMTIWPFTDFSDSRWHFGRRYITLRQDAKKGPTKIGLAHKLGWVAYLNKGTLFIKRFGFEEGKHYPDHGCNFETFTNQEMLEIETLGPMAELKPRASVEHTERWELIGNVKKFKTDAEIDKNIKSKVVKKK